MEAPCRLFTWTSILRATLGVALVAFVAVHFFFFDTKIPARVDRPASRTAAAHRLPVLDSLLKSAPTFYTRSDASRFFNVSQNLLYQDGQLPHVLVVQFADIKGMMKQRTMDGFTPGPAAWYLRTLCYTRAHGFDLELVSTQSHDDQTDGQVLPRGDHRFWRMMRKIQAYLESGKYDYVFVMMGDMLLNTALLEFPVWAYDLGHDITIMDQNKNNNGFVLNGILFRASKGTQTFLYNLLSYQKRNEVVLQEGHGAFLEAMLESLGLEAKENGKRGYSSLCKETLYLEYKSKHDALYLEQLAAYSECLFSELERLVGPYGYRSSKTIGFLKTYLWQEGKVRTYADVAKQGSLLPLPNCFNSLQTKQHWQDDCFAYYFNDAAVAHQSQGVQSTCPAAVDPWTRHYYGANDFLWYKDWSERSRYSRPPRVLIYTWCTENSFAMFANEAYWKSCYAHTHGYDVVFSEDLNVSGVKRPSGGVGGSFMDTWYSDDFMWAWNRDVQRYIFSGKYDYVFHVGADVLFLNRYLDFPLWAYDTGHDITIMDQNYVGYGYNQNAVLFKPTEFTRTYLDLHYSYRVDYWTQGDNGPWMEAMLVYLGREAQEGGRRGYDNHCAEHGIFTMPSGVLLRVDIQAAIANTTRYSECFFRELDRLTRGFGHRKSKHIGFSKTGYSLEKKTTGDGVKLPEHTDLLVRDRLMPWQNCFTHVRASWLGFERNCFAYHWNGDKSQKRDGSVTGTCPDPSFDWNSSPWNYLNRGKMAVSSI